MSKAHLSKEADAVSYDIRQASITANLSDYMRRRMVEWAVRLSEAVRAEPSHRLNFQDMQWRVRQWVLLAFGSASADSPKERVMRVLEEALELAQAEGLDEARAGKLLHHVYSRPVGDPAQEAAGVSTTLLAYTAAKGFELGELTANEMSRVESPQVLAIVRKKQTVRFVTGVADFGGTAHE